MKKYLILYFILLVFCFASCYDDLGNYDYDETVSDVVVKIDKVYGARKVDTIFVIRPVISQTHRTSNSNLRYVWTVNASSDLIRGDTLSKGDTLAIRINTKVADFKYNYYIRFYVTDTITGGKQMFPLMFNITKPYEGAWMILHSEDGITKLGSLEYVGDKMVVNDDAYFTERGEHLKGEPGSLGLKTVAPTSHWGYSSADVLYCFTSDADESGILRQDNKFELYGNVQKCIYPGHYSNFQSSDVQVCGNENGVIAISNGYVFQGSYYGPRLYGMFPNAEITGDYYVTHIAAGPHVQLVYDALGHRFFSCFTAYNYYNASRWVFQPTKEYQEKMGLLVKDPGNVAGVNLDDIGTDKEMVYMGGGYLYGAGMSIAWQRQAIYAFAKSKTTNKSYVYEFHSYPLTYRDDVNDRAPLTGFFTINTPAGVTAETPMASSCDFNRILFFAVDNRVYRLDFGTVNGSITLIYQHPNATKAVKMVMAREGKQGIAPYGPYGSPVTRSLGIAFDMGNGSGDLVILNLSNAGKVDNNGKYPSIQIHSGFFGKIKDIKFI